MSKNKELNQKILQLSIPIMLGSLSQTLMSTADTIMVGRLSREALAAAGLGTIFTFTFIIPLGLLAMGTRIKISRRVGEKNLHSVGTVVDNSLILAVFLGILSTLVLSFGAPFIMRNINPDPVVAELASNFVRIRFLAVPFFILIMTGQAFFEATSRTQITLYSSVLINGLNILFNAVLIFGLLGFPALGLMGAAWGSVLATICGLVFIGLIMYNPRERITYGVFSGPLSWVEARSILNLSIPSMLEGFGSIFSYFIFVWIHSLIGTVELAAASVLNSIYSLLFLPAMGLGKATGILVGQFLGSKDRAMARMATVQAMKLGAFFSGVIAVLGIIFARPLLSLYTPDVQVVQTALVPLFIILVGTSVNSMGMATRHTIIGAGMTRWTFKMQMIICYIIYLPLVYFLGIFLGLGIKGTYLGEALYFILVFVTHYWKFKQGDWQFHQV